MKSETHNTPRNDTPKSEIVVYQPDRTMRLEVRVIDESVWLPQQRIADLFGVQKAAISKHLKNIFATGELTEAATVSKTETVQVEGSRRVARLIDLYNLKVARLLPRHRRDGLAHRGVAEGRGLGALRAHENGARPVRHPLAVAVRPFTPADQYGHAPRIAS